MKKTLIALGLVAVAAAPLAAFAGKDYAMCGPAKGSHPATGGWPNCTASAGALTSSGGYTFDGQGKGVPVKITLGSGLVGRHPAECNLMASQGTTHDLNWTVTSNNKEIGSGSASGQGGAKTPLLTGTTSYGADDLVTITQPASANVGDPTSDKDHFMIWCQAK